MASKELQEIWKGYKSYYKANKANATLIDACCKASAHAVLMDGDLEYAFMITAQSKKWIKELIKTQTGGDFDALEVWSQENKKPVEILNQYYGILLLEAPFLFESFCLYIEKDRLKKERFYEPRMNPLSKVAEKMQALEDDKLDELFIHMPARVGKSQLSTLFMAWHCARNTEASNLYVTYKEGLGGAFLEGVQELITDPTYCFADVFPKVKIIDTDAKNNKMDLGTDRRRRKKYKSLSGKGLESGLNGEYDAYGVMLLDDILEGVQDVMSSEVLKRKQTIFDNNVMSRPKESCKIIYNGTIWATNDLFMNRLQFLEENPTAKNIRYEVIKIPALNENDESNFNYKYGVGYSTDYYKARRAKFEMNNDMAGWFAQCQQEPIDRTNAVFTPETMQYYDFLPEGEPIKVIAHCDVALGGGDFLSFPVAYYYENPDGSLTGYIEDVVFDNSEKHITQPQVVNMIAKHHIKQVHFESNQGGEGYKDDIKRLLKENGYKEVCNITSSWAPVTKRKDQRIWDMAQSIRELRFKDTSHRTEQYRMFMNNLFSFTMNMSRKKHDDAPDALAGLVEFENSGSGVKKAFILRSPI